MTARLLLGDCRELLADLEPDSVDAVVCDPPYELGFMGKGWDSSGVAFDPETWAAVLRVAKPGAHLIAFGGTRTMHRIACAIEDAGWTIRNQISWATWSGFPKSLDVSKSLDVLHGAEREVVGRATGGGFRPGRVANPNGHGGAPDITAPATDDAKRWAGWGTGIKPAVEPAILARKPLSESSVARNVLRWGTGALNIDACRFAPGDPMWPGPQSEEWATHHGTNGAEGRTMGRRAEYVPGSATTEANPNGGRFPANLVHCPKASRAEREMGCEGLPVRAGFDAVEREEGSAALDCPRTGAGRTAEGVRNHHATVKPLKLMRWLVRLVTPPGGLVLDPFMGSGTTGMAAVGQGFRFIGCELEPEHMQIARARIEYAASGQGVECDLEDIREPVAQVGLFR